MDQVGEVRREYFVNIKAWLIAAEGFYVVERVASSAGM